MADATMTMAANSCLGRTCMTWSDDGELEGHGS